MRFSLRTLLSVAVLLVSGCGSAGVDRKKDSRQVDATTLFNSIAGEFTQKYGGADARVSSKSGTFCDDKQKPVYVCNMKAKLILGLTDDWVYKVRLSSDGCWTARTAQKYGGNQESIDAYRNREFLAPPEKMVRRLVRQAKRLRVLTGCAMPVEADDDPAAFLAQYAAQTVQREHPGTQTGTTCKSRGKDEVALAPDSWNFTCTTSLVDGTKWVDEISCFDQPPYEDFASCSDDGPKKPPRALPE